MMKNIFDSMGVILGFLIISVLVQFFGGEKLSNNLLIFILLSMVLINYDKFTKIGQVFKKEEKEEQK